MYKPNDMGKKFDERMKLVKFANKNMGRDCSNFTNGKDGYKDCVKSTYCNWKEQGYTSIPRFPYSIESDDGCCYGVEIKEEELEEKKEAEK